MGADEKHIEGLCFEQSAEVCDFVHERSQKDTNSKNGNGLEYSFVFRFYVSRAEQEDSDGDHHAVADHGLDVDAGGGHKDLLRINHDAQPGKKGKSCKVRAARAVDPFAFQQGDEADVQGR